MSYLNNILLFIKYDGSPFLGWQKTKQGPSIEENLEKVLTFILKEKVNLQAASRTDRGVHANQQVVNFLTKQIFNKQTLLKSLNSLLPSSIAITKIETAPLSFHPTLNAKKKNYIYRIFTGTFLEPKERLYSWHIPYSLNIKEMKKAAKLLVGTKDFQSFSNNQKNASHRNTIKTIYNLKILTEKPNKLIFSITGNSFLYKMVRNIVGTLVSVGKNKLLFNSLHFLLLSKDRNTKGIVTAPPQGLFLEKVVY